MCLDTCLDINIGKTHSTATQCGQMSEAFGFFFFSVKVVKFIANKPQKSNFSYYRLQMCTSNQVSHESVIFALVGGGERRPGGRPFHRYVFIIGNNI